MLRKLEAAQLTGTPLALESITVRLDDFESSGGGGGAGAMGA